MDIKHSKRINEDLKDEMKIYLINEEGSISITDWQTAQRLANHQSLDLVEVGKKDNHPLCKIFNYSKYLYIKEKKKTKQKRQEIKEIQLSPNIAEHDLKVKIKKAEKIIKEGDKVRVVLIFKGRENQHKNLYQKTIYEFIAMSEEFAMAEFVPKEEGNKIFCILKEKKK